MEQDFKMLQNNFSSRDGLLSEYCYIFASKRLSEKGSFRIKVAIVYTTGISFIEAFIEIRDIVGITVQNLDNR